MRFNRVATTLTILAAVALIALPASAGRATRVAEAIWVDGSLYDTVATDTAFLSPPEQSTDLIYSFGMSGLQGQRSVAEAAPGDSDYNGGRWSVQMVVFTAQGLAVFDPDGDGFVNFEIMSDADLFDHVMNGDLEVFETSIYFECPLLPRRNR